MFCRQEKNNKKENTVSQPAIKESDVENRYVEIRQLAKEFSALSQYAREINEIGQENRLPNTLLFFYQKNIKRAFIDDFERRFEELLSKKMSFDDYWKTRAI